MPTEITGIAPDPLREVVRLGRSDNITIPTLEAQQKLSDKPLNEIVKRHHSPPH